MTTEIHLDDDPLATGTHKGGYSASILNDPGKDFKSCGVRFGLAIENETTDDAGLVISATENTVEFLLGSGGFSGGDTYNIYKTAEKDSFISKIYTDRRDGFKVNRRSELNVRGHFPDDEDLDADNSNVFGPGQPERQRRR